MTKEELQQRANAITGEDGELLITLRDGKWIGAPFISKSSPLPVLGLCRDTEMLPDNEGTLSLLDRHLESACPISYSGLHLDTSTQTSGDSPCIEPTKHVP